VVVEPGRRSSWPSSPAPGPVEAAVALVLAQALPGRQEAWAALRAHLLGLAGGPPVPAAQAAAAVGRPVGWLRGLLPRVRMVARHAGPPTSLVAAVRVLEDGPVRTVEEAAAALVAAGVCAGPVHAGGVLRAAEVLGAGCSAQLVDGGPGGGGAVVVAPAGRDALERSVIGAVVSADRRGDVVDLAEVAADAGVPVVAVRVVLERETGWQVHDAGDGSWWAWRRPLVRKRGLVTSAAVRLLAARAYDQDELHAAVVDVVDRFPPATRREATVPPAGVLVAWLVGQDLLEPADGGGLRCAPGLALASDAVLLEAVRAAGGTADAGQLAVALGAAGYSASTATQLARTCPVLVRVARGRYAPR